MTHGREEFRLCPPLALHRNFIFRIKGTLYTQGGESDQNHTAPILIREQYINGRRRSIRGLNLSLSLSYNNIISLYKIILHSLHFLRVAERWILSLSLWSALPIAFPRSSGGFRRTTLRAAGKLLSLKHPPESRRSQIHFLSSKGAYSDAVLCTFFSILFRLQRLLYTAHEKNNNSYKAVYQLVCSETIAKILIQSSNNCYSIKWFPMK